MAMLNNQIIYIYTQFASRASLLHKSTPCVFSQVLDQKDRSWAQKALQPLGGKGMRSSREVDYSIKCWLATIFPSTYPLVN